MVGRSENDLSIRVRSLQIERKIEELYIYGITRGIKRFVFKALYKCFSDTQGLKRYVCVRHPRNRA